MLIRFKLLIGIGLFSCMLSVQAATISFFTDKSLWSTAVGGVFLTEDFNDGILDVGISTTTSAGGIANNQWEDRLDPGPPDTTTFSFVPQILGFGGDWDLAGPGGAGTGIRLSIKLFNGVDEVLAQEIDSSLAGTFWGFVSDTAFTDVLLIAGSDPGGASETYTLDDLVYSQDPNAPVASAVPIPAAFWLFGTGLIGLMGWAKRNKKSS